MHMMAIFDQLKMPFDKNMHLLFLIEDFLLDKHKDQLWNFRLREDSRPLSRRKLLLDQPQRTSGFLHLSFSH